MFFLMFIFLGFYLVDWRLNKLNDFSIFSLKRQANLTLKLMKTFLYFVCVLQGCKRIQENNYNARQKTNVRS